MTAIFNLIKSSVGISGNELLNVDKLVVFIKKSKEINEYYKKISKEIPYL